jgi:exosortase A-associated hydrolase 1
MRFDYRGMGDSTGDARSFEAVSGDVRAAIDAFLAAVPQVKDVVLWGLCDGASAAVFYACKDPRVRGIVMINPWVRTESGHAAAHLKHYYWRRIVAPDFWNKVRRLQFDAVASVRGFVRQLVQVARGRFSSASRAAGGIDVHEGEPLPARMLRELGRFRGPILLILCGNDLTAKELLVAESASPQWKALLASSRVTRVDIPDANHTFSKKEWRQQVFEATTAWTMRAA